VSSFGSSEKPGKFESLSVCSAGAIDVILNGNAVLRCPCDAAPDSSDILSPSGPALRRRQMVMQFEVN
jgi:hypothetical protein